jgi:hypothetical protein
MADSRRPTLYNNNCAIGEFLGIGPLFRRFAIPGVCNSGILIEAPSDSDIRVQATRVRYRQTPVIADSRSSGPESNFSNWLRTDLRFLHKGSN